MTVGFILSVWRDESCPVRTLADRASKNDGAGSTRRIKLKSRSYKGGTSLNFTKTFRQKMMNHFHMPLSCIGPSILFTLDHYHLMFRFSFCKYDCHSVDHTVKTSHAFSTTSPYPRIRYGLDLQTKTSVTINTPTATQYCS